jgi:hypothetical protein
MKPRREKGTVRVMRTWLTAAIALALLLPDARAETLAPIDAREPGFAQASRERAPRRLWHVEAETAETRIGPDMRGKPQRQLGYHGLIVPGDGRALVALYEREAVDVLAAPVPGTARLFYRVVDGDGRRGDRVTIAAADDFGLVLDRGGGRAAVFGAWRDGTARLYSFAPDPASLRAFALRLPFKPLRLEAHGTGYLALLELAGDLPGDRGPKRAFHLVRFDGEGRILWRFQHPRDNYGFFATAARADGFTVAVLNDAPLKGIVAPVVALLLDANGKRVAKHPLRLFGNGGPAPTGLHALRSGGFMLTGFWWGPGGNFVAWLDRNGKLLRHADVTLGGFVEVQSILPLGDEGFLGTDDKGQILRFDRAAKLLWRSERPAGPESAAREVSIHDIRVLAGNGLLLAGSWGDYDRTKPGQPYVTHNFVERYRFE